MVFQNNRDETSVHFSLCVWRELILMEVEIRDYANDIHNPVVSASRHIHLLPGCVDEFSKFVLCHFYEIKTPSFRALWLRPILQDEGVEEAASGSSQIFCPFR